MAASARKQPVFLLTLSATGGGILLELSANVLAIIRRYSRQRGVVLTAFCQWVLQTRRRQALLRSRFSEQF
ncbi:hypothetical protein ACVOMT_22355 [Sphingomonas panni]